MTCNVEEALIIDQEIFLVRKQTRIMKFLAIVAFPAGHLSPIKGDINLDVI